MNGFIEMIIRILDEKYRINAIYYVKLIFSVYLFSLFNVIAFNFAYYILDQCKNFCRCG